MFVKNLIFYLFLILSTKANAFQCFVVSGLKHDYNKAFTKIQKDITDNQLVLKDHRCMIFQSWEELNERLFANGASNNSLTLKKNEKILIVQAAHGNPGGGATLDSKVEDSNVQLKFLKKISQDRSVAFIDQSCYSGDLLARKLFEDRVNPQNTSIDHLCMITSSAFTFPALASGVFGISSLDRFNFEKEENLENIFLSSDSFEVGLISSAAWDTDKFTDELSKIYLQYYLSSPGFALSGDSINEFLSEKKDCHENTQKIKTDAVNAPKGFKCTTINYILNYYAKFNDRQLSVSELPLISDQSKNCEEARNLIKNSANHKISKMIEILEGDNMTCLPIDYRAPVDLQSHFLVHKFTSSFLAPWNNIDLNSENNAAYLTYGLPEKKQSCQNTNLASEIIDRIKKGDESAKKEAADLSKDLLNTPEDLWAILADDHMGYNSTAYYLFASGLKQYSLKSISKELVAPLDKRRRNACRNFK
jgi:hypothetical protein